MRSRALIVVSTVALALTLAACKSSSAVGTNAYPIGNGVAVEVPAGQRGAPVELKGTTLDGATLDIASLRGQPVVLNVWGSWCAPCRKEAPALVAAAAQLKPDKVAFVGINTREDDPVNARTFDQTHNVTYPSLVDEGGELLLQLGRAVPPNAIPTTLVLDPQGRIAARFSGEITQTVLVNLVSDVTGITPAPDASSATNVTPAATAS